MSNHSVIEHRANYHFIKLEEDYLAICSTGKYSPHCKAMILAILEHWTNTKRDNGEEEYVYMTIPQWMKFTYMLFGRNAIIDCLQELATEGLIERRGIVMNDQDTYEYKLNIDPIQARLKELREKTPKEVFPNLDACLESERRNKVRRAEERKERGGSLNLNGGSLKINEGRLNTNLEVVEKQTTESFKFNRNLDTSNIDSSTQIDIDSSVAASADDAHTPQKNENDNQPQKLLIAHEKAKTEEINNVTPITQAPSASKRKVEVPTGPLEMPSDDAKWCDETAVQIIEVKKGRRYGEATRRQELTRAKEALRYQIDGQKITREQYILAWDNMCEWSLWTEKKIEPMIRHLLKDDRIVTLIQQKPKSVPNNGPKPRASVLVSEQQAEKNRARYFANREEKEAAYEAQKAKFQGKSRAIGE